MYFKKYLTTEELMPEEGSAFCTNGTNVKHTPKQHLQTEAATSSVLLKKLLFKLSQYSQPESPFQ